MTLHFPSVIQGTADVGKTLTEGELQVGSRDLSQQMSI